MDAKIEIGMRVRSFDFEGRDLEGDRACYQDGIVIGIGRFDFPDCDRYQIFVQRRIWAGAPEELAGSDPVDSRLIYPPVNGTPTMFRHRVTDGVVPLDEVT